MHNNYYAFMVRTDTQHWGHYWVVLFAAKDLNVVRDFRGTYREWIEFGESQIVKLCSDFKAVPGALVGDDEYNPVGEH